MTALVGWPVRHPGQALSLLILLAVFGIASLGRLKSERVPVVPDPVLRVQAELPGVDVAQMELAVTSPLEEALASTSALQEIVSRSSDGRATIELRFPSMVEREAAFDEVRARVARAASLMPAGTETPVAERSDPPPRAAAVYVATADTMSDDVIAWVGQQLVKPIRELPGVASVVFEGAGTGEVLIEPDARRLAVLGLGFDDLVQALRRSDEAPRRRSTRRRNAVALPASAEAIAARAVRLPDGESIALGEVAEVSMVTQIAARPLRHAGTPALQVSIYPQSSADAAAVAERVDFHLKWLRANGLIRAGVALHAISDEARETRAWRRQILRIVGVNFAVLLALTYLCFGVRDVWRCVYALVAWLLVSVLLLWAATVPLSVASATGLLFAGVVLMTMLARVLKPAIAPALAILALLAAWAGAEWLRTYVPALEAFALATVSAGMVCWLLPSARFDAASAPLVRLLVWMNLSAPRPLLTALMLTTALGSAAAGARALPTAMTGEVGGTLQLRLQGAELQRLSAWARDAVAQLRAVPDLDNIVVSSAADERWQLELDTARMEELDLSLAEVGRAFAIARDGLIVGEVVDADARLPLRLRLARGMTGEDFARLLLRGEYKDHRAVYLRDIGTARRVPLERERLHVQLIPAVEIIASWRTAQAPPELSRLRNLLVPPPGYSLSWKVFSATTDAGTGETGTDAE